ncbi:PREDICTED: matrilin-2 [Cyprinodon variegatus]|uniref:matrilin-2 n=1 Tax=Cyprinodon variegatus TaxID=28743 RepID=UPI0007428BD9|nr:PREDICTED: matrilin-2 [Cyprinodon variegatus]
MRSLALGLFCLFCCNAVEPERRRPKLITAKGQNNTTVQNNTMENSCETMPLDFVFVIDSSRSIRPEDYEKVKTFIINLLQFLDVGHNATRVGLLQYGSVVQPEFSLNTYYSKAEVKEAVRNMSHLATGTMTGLAIQYTMEVALTEEQGARPLSLQIPRIAMIVTDGRPQDTVEEIAAQAKQAGIQIFAIGVGRVEMKTLKAIGSEPHSEHVHLVANFSQMETLISVFKSKLCGGSDMCKVVDHQCQHICVNSPASYRCKCRKGFTLNPDGKTCKGIDYCDLGIHGCEHNCVSLPGSYICSCMKGYVLNSDGKTCSQSDHCADGSHGCEQEFMSTATSCVCKCRDGYTLRPDGKTCKKIDHCADGTHGCEQEFINTEDSCVCKCREGYTLKADGKTCQSVDLCQTLDHGCEHLCVSTTASYICKCYEGFLLAGDGKSCEKPGCLDGVMDLVFVIDGSKSLGPANFELVKQFVNSIVDSLNISRTGTHVGLIQFSTKVRTEFTLSRHTTGQDIKRAVNQMQYMGRGSMTGSALRHMFQFSFSEKEGGRSNIPRVCVVFTDGRSQDDVSEWASKAKNSGVTIYALGVGKAIEQELREIASEPSEMHLYYAEDFKKMGEITQKLKSRICKDRPADENMCRCENIILFQNQVTEQLKNLAQSIEALSKKLETLENQVVRK